MQDPKVTTALRLLHVLVVVVSVFGPDVFARAAGKFEAGVQEKTREVQRLGRRPATKAFDTVCRFHTGPDSS